jgi:hypothetical protein
MSWPAEGLGLRRSTTSIGSSELVSGALGRKLAEGIMSVQTETHSLLGPPVFRSAALHLGFGSL